MDNQQFNKQTTMVKKILLISLALIALTACKKTAFTNRKALRLIPSAQLNQMSFTEYRGFLQKNPPKSSGPDVDMVRRVGNDIKLAVETYYGALNLTTKALHLQEFNKGNSQNTVAYVQYLQALYPGKKLWLLWENASYHRFAAMQEFLATLNDGLPEEE